MMIDVSAYFVPHNILKVSNPIATSIPGAVVFFELRISYQEKLKDQDLGSRLNRIVFFYMQF